MDSVETGTELEQQIDQAAQEEIAGSDAKVVTVKQLEEQGADKVEHTPQDWLQRHLTQVYFGTQSLEKDIKSKGVSRRTIERVLVAILQLPSEHMKSTLKTDQEKELFLRAQQIQNSKFAILEHYIREQARALKDKEAQVEVSSDNLTIKEEENVQQETSV